jgi:hypothetical protein
MPGDLGHTLLIVFAACAGIAYFGFYVAAARDRRGRPGLSRDKDC